MSAGSRPLSLACWRMMSSWRSGRVISRTAWWNCGHTRTIAIATSSAAPTASGEPAAQHGAPAGGRPACGRARAAAGGGMGMGAHRERGVQLLKDRGQRKLQLLDSSAVCDHVRRPGRFLLLRKLARGPLVDRVVAARGGALGAHVLVGDDRDGGVVGAFQAGLEEQRRLHDGGARRRVLVVERGAPPRDARAHQRPQQALEPRALVGGREGLARDGGAVDDAARRHLGAPARGDRVAHLVGAIELVDHGVGGDRGRAQPRERGERRGLARAQPAGQPDEGDAG